MITKLELFKSYLNKFNTIDEGICEALVKHLNTKNIYEIDDNLLVQVAEKMRFFISINHYVQVKEVFKDGKESDLIVHDFRPEDKDYFLEYYKNISKKSLLVIDKMNALNLGKDKIFIDTYEENDAYREYFNYLEYDYRKNLIAAYNFVVLNKEPEESGFYGYIHLMDDLLNDINIFKNTHITTDSYLN